MATFQSFKDRSSQFLTSQRCQQSRSSLFFFFNLRQHVRKYWITCHQSIVLKYVENVSALLFSLCYTLNDTNIL